MRYEDEWALTEGRWPSPWDFEANALVALRILTSDLAKRHDAQVAAEAGASRAVEDGTVIAMTVNANGRAEARTPEASPAESMDNGEMPPDLPF